MSHLRHYRFSLPLGLLLLCNILLLAHVVYNRSSVDYELVLTEREFDDGHYFRASANKQDSGRRLMLDIDQEPLEKAKRSIDKVKSLGFCEAKYIDPKSTSYRRQGERPVYVALSNNGPEFLDLEKKRIDEYSDKCASDELWKENAYRCHTLRWKIISATRLLAVDISKDRNELVSKYEGKEDYFILPARASYRGHCVKNNDKYPYRSLYVKLSRNVHLPKQYLSKADPLAAAIDQLYKDVRPYDSKRPTSIEEVLSKRYHPVGNITVRYGRLAEPWLVSILENRTN